MDPLQKNSHLTTVLFHADTPKQMDDANAANQGLVKRRDILTDKKIDMLGHLHCDVFNQENFYSTVWR